MESETLVDELLTTSRLLVGIAVRAVGAAPVEITVAQNRLLTVLAESGARSVGEIADYLGVNPSNATRHCDRLQRLGLVSRRRSEVDGRVVEVEVTPAGRSVVEAVMERRREELAAVVGQLLDEDDGEAVVAALRKLNIAAHAVSAL